MKTGVLLASLILLAIASGARSASPLPEEPQAVAVRALEILRKNCIACHGETGFARSSMLLDHKAMIRTGKIVPGRAEESILYKRITGAVEPVMPEGGDKLPEADIAAIREWIDAGAPAWAAEPASLRFKTSDEVIQAIERDLQSFHTESARRFLRYFTLTTLPNSGEARLSTYRNALTKLLNSLSWDKEIVRPIAIDPEATIFRIDLRDFDWSDPVQMWETILAGYPYGVEFPGSGFARIQQLTGARLPFIRADWFAAAASLPPLYHEVLELPAHESDLESCTNNARRCLHVDVERNLREAPGVRVVRAGFSESGVSNSNRVVERHRSPYGAYWKSHDFPDNIGEHNIFQNPLTFRRAGGEIIFNLPNGMQAYLLVNERGERIDEAPTNIVFYKGGSRAEIRNGLSCMACHSQGMRPFKDDVRATLPASPSFDRTYASDLYVEDRILQKLLLEDQRRFEDALHAAGIQPGIEPIAELAQKYSASVDASAAAAELGLSKDQLLDRIRQNSSLGQLGLATLVAGGTVKRDAWEDVFGSVVETLGAGLYVAPARVYGERSFGGGTAPIVIRRTFDDVVRTIRDGMRARPVRFIENGRVKNYTVRDVRVLPGCSAEVVDVVRYDDEAGPQEYIQSLSFRSIRVEMTDEGGVRHLRVKADAPSLIQIESNGIRNFLPEVQFDLPRDTETDAVFESFRDAIALCSTDIRNGPFAR